MWLSENECNIWRGLTNILTYLKCYVNSNNVRDFFSEVLKEWEKI
jgi:hypothetical protein